MKHNLLLAAACLLFSFGLSAQPQGRPEPPKQESAEELAQKKVDLMDSELGLTKKQYKKAYKLFKKDFQYRQDAMEEKMSERPQGGPGGMGGPGGGMGGPGGGMGPGGMGMGGPGGGMGMGGPGGMGAPDGMEPGSRPEGGPGMNPMDDVITEEYLEKQEKKLKKILTDEQYTAWRAKHPAEHLELPPIELK